MGVAKFTAKIKNAFSTIGSVWKLEIAISAILLLAFLAFDFKIYYDFVVSPGINASTSGGGASSPVFFKKAGLDRAVAKIESYADFIDNPSFQSLPENPF